MARIILIEDNDTVRKMLKMTLEGAGYEVAEAPEGGAGIDLYRQEASDLVITDMVMPGKDGFETIMELWRDFPNVKIIAISGSAHAVDPETCLDYARTFGAIKALRKPIRSEVLLNAVEAALCGADREDEGSVEPD